MSFIITAINFASLREALGGVPNHGGNLGDLDPVTLDTKVHVDVLHESIQVISLEVAGEFLQECLHVREVELGLLFAELQLEEVEDQGVGVRIGVVHVGLNGVGEVAARDVASAVPRSLHITNVTPHKNIITAVIRDGYTYIIGSAEQVEALRLPEVTAAHADQVWDLIDSDRPVGIVGVSIAVRGTPH